MEHTPSMENKIVVTFDETTKSHILNRLGISVDGDGYLIDKKTSMRILGADETEIRADQLAAITKGSLKLYDSETSSLLKLVDAIYK